MIARIVNQAADVIHRAQVNGAQTAAGLAIALESARLLVSDEMVHQMAALEAERDALKARVDEVERAYAFDTAALKRRIDGLEAERHVTNEALDDAVTELRTSFAEQAPRETHPGRRQAWRMLAQIEESERVADALLTPETERAADEVTRLLAPTQALREPEGEFHQFLHHAHTTPHDMPETGGAGC